MKLESEFIKLPVSFDTQRLVEEVSAFTEADWRPHPTGFRGNSSLVLISRDGGQNDDMAGVMQATPFLQRCPYIQQVMDSFRSVIGRSRLMRLDGGSEVSEHSDIDYHWYSRVRIHVPVVTRPEVRFYCNQKNVHMAAGEAWIFDSWQMHRVVNPTAGRRIHLVIDTSGSPAFWDMVAHGRTIQSLEAGEKVEARFVPYDKTGDVRIRTERYNAAVVMVPGEVDALLLDLLADVNAMPGMAAQAVAAFAALVHEFRRGWRMVWGEYGSTEAGWHHYRKLLARAQQQAAAIRYPLRLASNEAAAVEVLQARVLRHALNPEFAAGLTLPAPAAAERRQVNALAAAGVSRNALCPCGSGKKYKRCHGA